MSYDIHLVRVPPSMDPLAVALDSMEREEEGEATGAGTGQAESEARKRRMVDALVAAEPRLAPFAFDYALIARELQISAAEARWRYRHVELNDEKDGVQITLHDEMCDLSISYWHDAQAAARVFGQVWTYLKILRETGGLQAYDPQLERILDLERDRPAVLAAYGGGVESVRSATSEPLPRKRPWWKLW